MTKLRLGIIGCGWVSTFYGQATRTLADRCEWAWAADPNQEAARKFCGDFGGQPLADYHGARADAIIIATPHHLHAPIYLDIAPSGVPVLIEKPLALSVAEADWMIAARDAAKALLMVGYVNRYRPGPRALHQALAAGQIGEPLFWDAVQFCNVEGYVQGWLATRATLGGGVFFSSSGHLLDLLVWYNGPVDRLKLETARYRIAMEGEDTQLSVVRFRNGRLASLRESWCARRGTLAGVARVRHRRLAGDELLAARLAPGRRQTAVGLETRPAPGRRTRAGPARPHCRIRFHRPARTFPRLHRASPATPHHRRVRPRPHRHHPPRRTGSGNQPPALRPAATATGFRALQWWRLLAHCRAYRDDVA